ncbi:HPP family protein [Nitrogeniibacter mangrovi]|uniref:HPP family protein n=1 Tax=Nitrogeniibacter mangrovi TaxID=2016596 RepID=A0A6C1B211_9RHOO|nr:HPP family protein [Nitrogeniibacter mangrovi]QID17672.1 HPP family protein [Nitrogeniibacter mangrovi]
MGACLGILFAGLVTAHLVATQEAWLVAPLGASAVLVFAVPSSPLSQPWSVVVGNTVSALVGIACVALIPDRIGGAAIAVALAIAVMMATRSLHPPGGATALLAVLSQAHSPAFALHPVALNSALLVIAGMAFHRLGGHHYPHRAPPPRAPRRFDAADIDEALRRHDELLDVSREDIESLLEEAETAAYRRTLGALRCGDLMARPVLQVTRSTPVAAAHQLMRKHAIKALPVTGPGQQVVGILTAWDVLEHLATRQAGRHAVVGALMSTPVATASADQPVVELARLIAEGANHHIPILDAHRRLVGILTQSDLIRALHHAVHASHSTEAS